MPLRRVIARCIPREIKVAAKDILAHLYTFYYWRTKLGPSRSFSQADEDLIVAQLLGNVSFFVDIGANDGITYSNSLYFALRGANGICFEPTRTAYAQLSSLYRFNPRVICRKCGISNRSRESRITSAGGLSCLPDTQDLAHSAQHSLLAELHFTESVQLLTFEDATSGIDLPKVIDLLSVDVEGHELNVLSSIPFDKYHFRAIVLETHIRDEWRHRDQLAIDNLLRSYGYVAICETWVNTIYCRISELRVSSVEHEHLPHGNSEATDCEVGAFSSYSVR